MGQIDEEFLDGEIKEVVQMLRNILEVLKQIEKNTKK